MEVSELEKSSVCGVLRAAAVVAGFLRTVAAAVVLGVPLS